MKVLIGLPLPFNIDCPGRQSMTKVLNERSNIDISTAIAAGANIWQLRNRIAGSGNQKKFQRINYDFYLSTDWDIKYDVKDIEKLLYKNKPILSGAYSRKKDQTFIHAGYWKKDIIGVRGQSLKSDGEGIKKVDWVGGGFLLIRKDVLEKMEYPWFRSEIVEYGENQEATSADFGFCMNAARHGISIYVDYNCTVEHINI